MVRFNLGFKYYYHERGIRSIPETVTLEKR